MERPKINPEVKSKTILISDLPEPLGVRVASFLHSMSFPWRRDPIGAHPLVEKKPTESKFSEMKSPHSPFGTILGMTREDAVRDDAKDVVKFLSKYANEAKRGVLSAWGMKLFCSGIKGQLLDSVGQDVSGLELLIEIVEFAKGSEAEMELRQLLSSICDQGYWTSLVENYNRITEEQKEKIIKAIDATKKLN